MVLTGSVPVEGAFVRVAGQSGTTDGSGYYSLSEVPASYGGVSAVKAGYAALSEVLTVSGDTRHDFQLGPRIAIYMLSGVVSEMTPSGPMPVQGVVLEELSCEDIAAPASSPHNPCPASISQTTTTDQSGRYSFSGLYAGAANVVWARKEAFEDPFPQQLPDNSEGGHAVRIDGSTRFDIQLVRR